MISMLYLFLLTVFVRLAVDDSINVFDRLTGISSFLFDDNSVVG